MSDDYLRVVPTAPDWVPPEPRSAAAAGAIREMCPDAHELTIHRYTEVTFVDQGGNFESVRCPACQAVLETEWWQERMDAAYATGFEVLAAVTPCCSSDTSLNDLEYRLPAGFARFMVEVRGPGRGWLSDDEMAQVSAALGTTVRQILAHY